MPTYSSFHAEQLDPVLTQLKDEPQAVPEGPDWPNPWFPDKD